VGYAAALHRELEEQLQSAVDAIRNNSRAFQRYFYTMASYNTIPAAAEDSLLAPKKSNKIKGFVHGHR